MKRFFAVLALCAVTVLTASEAIAFKPHTRAEYECCYQFFQVMGTARSMDETVEKTVEIQLSSLPLQVQGLKPVITDFCRKYMSYDALKKDLADLYLRHFTVEEIKELTKFYSTPVGKKISEKQPILIMEAMQLGQSKIQEHVMELQQAVMKEFQKAAPQEKETKNVK